MAQSTHPFIQCTVARLVGECQKDRVSDGPKRNSGSESSSSSSGFASGQAAAKRARRWAYEIIEKLRNCKHLLYQHFKERRFLPVRYLSVVWVSSAEAHPLWHLLYNRLVA